MIDRKALLTDLKKQVVTLEGALRERAADDEETHARLHGEWQKAREANRIAATYESWLDDRVTQAAVAWVLGTVFLRFCEDNGLIEMPFLAGPGEKLDLAQERQADYIRQNPHDTDRDWILAGFGEMSRSPVAAGLFDKAHNPMWQIEIPHHAAKALLAFWRRRNEDGQIVHDFTDPDWDTRFLGDLYQDLSEHAKKTYALLQTPDFVEEFILDYTLEPAVDEFGLAGLRLIDPTCGSGHFLLGAFHRILNKWRDAEPGTDIWELIRRTLLSVHGVDKNPFATNIARFRLLVAAMKAGGVSVLAQAPEFPIVVATGDSLRHGRGAPGIQEDLFADAEPFTYSTEDIYEFIGREDDSSSDAVDLLGAGSYHAVVGNPPYIRVDDACEREAYRKSYPSCYGEYQLSVPFVERFFQLAKRNPRASGPAGRVGQITGKAFSQSKFGKKLIENFFPEVELTHVIDTSGVRIRGHGTPTVILFGMRRWPTRRTVNVVRGIRAEPSQPQNPADGLVWNSITGLLAGSSVTSDWVEFEQTPREKLYEYPWLLSGGINARLIERFDKAEEKIGDFTARAGYFGDTHADEAFIISNRLEDPKVRPLLGRATFKGEHIRDWQRTGALAYFFPYDKKHQLMEEEDLPKEVVRHFWPLRTSLLMRSTFGGMTYRTAGRKWWEWHQLPQDEASHPWTLAFAAIATHPHFVLDREGSAFVRSAPILKLRREVAQSTFFRILSVLNSSSGSFWIRQRMAPKGGSGEGRGVQDELWEERFTIDTGKLQDFPLPTSTPEHIAIELDKLGQEMERITISKPGESRNVALSDLRGAEQQYKQLRGRMMALQEELDWFVYYSFGLISQKDLDAVTVDLEFVLPAIESGQRAFEIRMAREMDQGRLRTDWFRRHGTRATKEIPAEWPEIYKNAVRKRIEIIGRLPEVAAIERPEYKRRWASESWAAQRERILRCLLLDRCESRSLWFISDEHGNEQPRTATVNQLADRLRLDEGFKAIARLYAGEDAELSEVIAAVVKDEHVPHVAAARYKDLSTWRQWRKVWDLQREEDRTGKWLDIPRPPKYKSADFREPSYFRNRGKYDVPKERFISYPGSGPDGDSSLLLGWAGWDHREQAQALMMLIEERATQDGWDAARLTPLLAGLAEVLPWVRQWHGEVDPAFGQSPADAYAMYLEDKQREYGISDDDLKNWRPEKPKRGGRKKKDS